MDAKELILKLTKTYKSNGFSAAEFRAEAKKLGVGGKRADLMITEGVQRGLILVERRSIMDRAGRQTNVVAYKMKGR